MLNAIKTFFSQNIAAASKGGETEQHALRLATAALLFEMMRMDDEIHPSEVEVLKDAIGEKFSLGAEETRQLLELAEREAEDATDYHQFTSLINQHFSPDQKIKVVEHLWQVAYADGKLNKHEEHLVRKVSELIHVSHRAFIAAKHRAAPTG